MLHLAVHLFNGEVKVNLLVISKLLGHASVKTTAQFVLI